MKLKNLKCVIMFLFSAIFILTSFTACQPSSKSASNPEFSENPDLTKEEQTTVSEGDDLPDDLNYEGYVFNIYTRENSTFYRYVIEEDVSEILNDSIYKRTRNVEERLGITLAEKTYTDHNAPRTFMLAGLGEFDMYNVRCSHAITFWLEGLTVEIPELPYIDLEKPYWNKTANKVSTLKNHQYIAFGAANICMYDFTFTLLFNKQMISDFSLESPYILVNNGKWTLDKMDEMMKVVISDLNGDGKFTIDDKYGYVSRAADALPAFWIGAELLSVAKDENDIPYLAIGEEKFINLFQKVFEITWDSNAWFTKPSGTLTMPSGTAGNVPATSVDLFMGNQSLFMDVQMPALSLLRGMETDFGIIPYPKYDEKQKNYYGRVGAFDTFVVDKSNAGFERTSAVIEALNSDSYKTVLPQYYEVCLKTRTSRDDESEDMLDIVFDNLIIDLGDTVWLDKIRDAVFAGMFSANNRNIISKIDSMTVSIQKDIDKILELE